MPAPWSSSAASASVLEQVTARAARAEPVRGGDLCVAERVDLGDGTRVFVKRLVGAPAGLFDAEAQGLAWLSAAPGAPPVPEVLTVTDDLLVLEWVEPGPATADSAEELGRALARMHRAGSEGFGAPWSGHLGHLDLDNGAEADWPTFWAERRIRPLLRRAVDAGAVSRATAAVVEAVLDRLPSVAGPAEPPARLHGDLWSGNVHHGADGRAWLVDPAAHGGHRESDLALLRLFGAPHLDRALAAYAETWPLADGADERVPLHQLHPLLAHAVMFGGGYGSMVEEVARRCP